LCWTTDDSLPPDDVFVRRDQLRDAEEERRGRYGVQLMMNLEGYGHSELQGSRWWKARPTYTDNGYAAMRLCDHGVGIWFHCAQYLNLGVCSASDNVV
jgi:hypothetical protein